MPFHSFTYIALFFPVTLLVFLWCRRFAGPVVSSLWLLISSLVFYAWGDPASLPILVISIIVNYSVGTYLQKQAVSKKTSAYPVKLVFVAGLFFNILLLAFFKYAGFLVINLNWVLQSDVRVPEIMLPLAVSFYTFQQISYLVDSYRGEIENHGWLEYMTYTVFFPKLISGPITRYKELAPQLRCLSQEIDYKNASIGIFLFFVGLLKVVTAARVFGTWADKGFADTAALSLIDGWTISLSYTFQIYFDFSGYTDMAIGSARFFNIQLPINFDSPYHAANIQDFWRRWHITLSRFLRDYLYFPLGGNRRGPFKTYANIIITFLICGLWHGASWMFITWGALHGLGMVINRLWQKTKIQLPLLLSVFVTFNFVNIAWVFFRAENMSQAIDVLKAMTGLGITSGVTILYGLPTSEIIIAIMAIIVLFFTPNSNQIPERFRPTGFAAVYLTAIILISLLFLNSSVSREFIYFDF
jgi:D-alanyl-lipoteichoic acid acyltransferase DltB (MBOAT superfamily)